MAEVKTDVQVNPRQARRDARLKLLAPSSPPTVKVYAGSEDMRRVLRHPTGVRFRGELGQAVEWPLDSFTTRRLASGAVRADGPGPAKSPEPDPKLSLREQIAARRPKPKDEQREPSKDESRGRNKSAEQQTT